MRYACPPDQALKITVQTTSTVCQQPAKWIRKSCGVRTGVNPHDQLEDTARLGACAACWCSRPFTSARICSDCLAVKLKAPRGAHS